MEGSRQFDQLANYVSAKSMGREERVSPENPYEPPPSESSAPLASRSVARGNFALAIGASFVIGFLVWSGSRYLTGKDEPWDSAYPFYSLCMLLSGTLIGIAAPRQILFSWIGIWLGQLSAVMIVPWLNIDWFPLAMISTAIGGLLLLPGLMLGWGIRALWNGFANNQA